MIPTKHNPLGILLPVGDVSSFRVLITAADISGSTAYHAFSLTASSGCKIAWGDGFETAWTANGLYTHTYSAAGTYLIQIKGPHTRFYQYGGTPEKVVEAIRLYSGLTSCENAFRECSNAAFTLRFGFKIPSLVSNCSFMFAYCSGANFTLPAGFTIPNTVTNVYAMFRNCSGAAFSLPSGFALSTALVSINSLFVDCTGVGFTSLPSSFFIHPSIKDIGYLMRNCLHITTDISGVFPVWDAGSSVSMNQSFSGCAGLIGTLPSALLWGRTDITWTVSLTFYNCTSLTNYASIPAAWK